MSTYRKLWCDFWDEDWPSLDAELLAAYLLTSRHSTTEGFYAIKRYYMTGDLGWTDARLDKALAELGDFASYDERVMFVHKALLWNPPKGRPQVTGAINQVVKLPASILTPLFIAAADEFAPEFGAALHARFNGKLEEPVDLPEKPEKPKRERKPKVDYTEPFMAWWDAYGKVGSRADALVCYTFWRGKGASEEELLTAGRNYHEQCVRTDTTQKHAATFLAKTPNRWEEWVKPEAVPAPTASVDDTRQFVCGLCDQEMTPDEVLDANYIDGAGWQHRQPCPGAERGSDD